VAIADAGAQRFGTGSTSVRVSQDLQLLSGLPPLVRDGDRFSASFTVRNTTAREMKVHASLQGTVRSTAGSPAATVAGAPATTAEAPAAAASIVLPAQELMVAAGGAKVLHWPVEVPAGASGIEWSASVEEQAGAGTSERADVRSGEHARVGAGERASDRLRFTQRVVPAVPLRVLQASIEQLDGALRLPVTAPADALRSHGIPRGGVLVAAQPRLGSALPGLQRYFEDYPFSCLEQLASKAIGLRDQALWSRLGNALPTYLDRDGLANYFPARAEDGNQGSDRLTAYLLAVAHEAGYALPAGVQAAMLDGLTAFVEGRIERRFWSPRADLDVRKLAALEALSRYARMQPRMLGSLRLTPGQWPTAAVIDWLNILHRVDGIPQRAARIGEAQQILRARLTWGGTTLRFSNENDDFWWWLMDSADANASRLILAVLDEPAWREELPRMVLGSLARQHNGAWINSTANLWGSLALEKCAARFEAVTPQGRTQLALGASSAAIAWARQPEGGTLQLPWPDAPAVLELAQHGSGRPWITVQSLAAVPLNAPLRAGYSVTRSVSAGYQQAPGHWSRGDVMRVRLEVDAQSDMTWVVVSDPVPGGATILGSGLGRDSALATRSETQQDSAWPAYQERSFEAYRSYYRFLPRGKHAVEYTIRLNNAGQFTLPPTRVEALY
ncbi:MAG: alpha-2-macroglobulin, partial [Burkholderiaceae bacterium]|nr:alpha-2-macroglobulin [Burkholderiaceae bacterium]